MDAPSPELLLPTLVILILISGFFSSSETALMAINRYRLKHLVKENHSGAKRVNRLLERPDRLIGVILIGNNLVNIGATAIATLLAEYYYGTTGVLVATFALTLAILVFSEVGPKTVAAYHPEKIAFPASLVLLPLLFGLRHVVWLVNQMSLLIVRPLGINPANHQETSLSSEELRTMVLESQSANPADQKSDMLVNILDLNEADVDDILVRRNDIIGIDLEADPAEIRNTIVSANYTRLPVYENDINNILGIFHLRNAAKVLSNGDIDVNGIKLLMKEPYFIQENTALTTQLREFQATKERVAMVVDEYGEVMGLVTLEDILEEIVGDFTSDVADNVPTIVPQDDDSFIIEGTTTLRDINKTLGWNLDSEDAITLNGLLLEKLESFPEAQTGIQIGDYRFEIISISDNRIDSVAAIRV